MKSAAPRRRRGWEFFSLLWLSLQQRWVTCFLVRDDLVSTSSSGAVRSQPPTLSRRSAAVAALTALPDPASFLPTINDLRSALPEVSFEDDPLEAAKIAIPALGLLCVAAAATRAPARLVSPSLLDSILAGTYLEPRTDQVRCVYKATRDGWSALTFHEAVDGLGSALVVVRSIAGQTFGGFNPNGFRSTDDYYTSSAAFLWCLKGGTNRAKKLQVLAGGNCAVFDYATAGPCFGAADLLIGPPRAAVLGGFAGPDAEDLSQSAGNLRQCRSSVGSTYDFDPSWPARGATRLVEVEVYAIPRN